MQYYLIKFLGVHLDEKLNWKNHITTVSNKINRGIFALNQVKNILPFDSLRTLYYTLIHSHMIYCLEVWGNSSSMNKIVKLQKRAIRIIHKKSYRSHTEPLFKQSRILKITDLYKVKLSLFAYDFKTSLLPKSFVNFFPVNNTRIVTRQLNNLYITRPRTTFSASSVAHKIVHVWNNLSIDIKSLTTRPTFSRNLKQQHIDSYLDTIICSNVQCHQCHRA